MSFQVTFPLPFVRKQIILVEYSTKEAIIIGRSKRQWN